MHTAVKPYHSCRCNHAAIDAVLQLVLEHELNYFDIARIDIQMDQFSTNLVGSPEIVRKTPINVVDGQFSIYFAAAVSAVEGQFSWSSYDRLGDPTIQDLLQRVYTSVDGSVPPLGARVTITTVNGEPFIRDVPLPRGEPEDFLTWQECQSKFRGLAKGILDDDGMDQVVNTVMELDRLDNIKDLTRLLRS